jgi:hypothetical protein
MIPSIKNSQAFKFDNDRYLNIIAEEKDQEAQEKLRIEYRKFLSLVDTMDRSVGGMGELGAVNFDYQIQLRTDIEQVRANFETLIKENLQNRQQK